MPSPLPYIQMYHKEWLVSTRRLTLAARAIYWDLLCFQWEEGWIPDDVEEIAAMVGGQLPEVRKAWPSVRAHFQEMEPGQLIHPRMQRDRENALAVQQRNIDNGHKGGRPKKNPDESDPLPKPKPKEKGGVISGLSKNAENRNPNETETKPIPEPYTYNSEPNGSGETPSAQTPFAKAERVMNAIHSALDWNAPVPIDIRRQIKPDSPVQVLISEHGEEGATNLFLFAYAHWQSPPTWASVCGQRNQLAEQMKSPTTPNSNLRAAKKDPGQMAIDVLRDLEKETRHAS